MGRLSGLLLLASIANFIIGNPNDDCQGDVCFHPLYLDLYKSSQSSKSGLIYTETIGVTSKARDALSVCMPNVGEEFVASRFLSCGRRDEVCTFEKRGWLIQDADNKWVANADLLVSKLKDLPGGEEAVRQCLQLPEDDDYYYVYEEYDYSDYGDDWDFMEEAGGVASRVRREAGKGNNEGGKGNKGGKGKKGGKARKGKNKGGKNKANKNRKKGKNPTKKAKKQAAKQEKKQARKAKKQAAKQEKKQARKAKKQAKKEKNKEKKEARKATKNGNGNKQDKSGKEKTDNTDNDEKNDETNDETNDEPSQPTLKKLRCVYHEVRDLLYKCAEQKLNE